MCLFGCSATPLQLTHTHNHNPHTSTHLTHSLTLSLFHTQVVDYRKVIKMFHQKFPQSQSTLLDTPPPPPPPFTFTFAFVFVLVFVFVELGLGLVVAVAVVCLSFFSFSLSTIKYLIVLISKHASTRPPSCWICCWSWEVRLGEVVWT